MSLISASAMQLTVWSVLAALFLTFGFMAGVRFANNEHQRNTQWRPTQLPVPLPATPPHRDFYDSQHPPVPAPVSLTVNMHTTPAPQREYVLDGEMVPALTERQG